VIGCDDSVMSAPSLNWALSLIYSAERFWELALIRF
jgi:hypothetical protein